MADGKPGMDQGDHTSLKEHQIHEVVRLISKGGTRSEVLALVTGDWGLSVRTADRLIAAARKEFAECWNIERPELLAQLLSQAQGLAVEARRAGNHQAALAALRTIAKWTYIET
jgi:hypothetical protein